MRSKIRNHLSEMYVNLTSEPNWLERKSFYFLFFTMIVGTLFTFNFMPKDDILRDIIIYKYDFDYNLAFPFSTNLFGHNLWIGTDYLSYSLHLFYHFFGLSDDYIYMTYQSIIMIALIYMFNRSLLKFGYPDSYKTYVMTILLTLITLIIMGANRFVSARPEALFSVLCFYAIFLSPRVFIALLTILSPLYWLAPIYSLGIILNSAFIQMSKFAKVRYLLMSFIFPSLFWFVYMGGDYVLTILDIFIRAKTRELSVGENLSIYLALSIPLALFVVYFAVKGFVNKKSEPIIVSLAIVAIYFILPNMIRYTISVVISLLLIALYAFRDTCIKLKIDGLFFSFIIANFLFSIIILLQSASGSKNLNYKGIFEFPEDSIVFDIDGINHYRILYLSKNKIKMIPSIEVSKNEDWIKKIMFQNHKKDGDIDCHALVSHGVNYVTSSFYEIGSTSRDIPSCFNLVATDGVVKIFKIDAINQH